VTVAGDVISHVNISRVAVEDGGVYECAAENRVGRTTHSAALRVYGEVTYKKHDGHLLLPQWVFISILHCRTKCVPLDQTRSRAAIAQSV
jgi:hypothetical protein